MIRVRVRRVGDAAAELRVRLARITRESLRALAEKLGVAGVHEIEANIMDQVMLDGEPMLPLKHLRRRGHSPEAFVEFDRGQMFKTLWYQIVGASTVIFGSPEEYAIYQNRGTYKRGTGRPGESVAPGITGRHFIGVRDSRQDVLQQIAQEHVILAWEGAGT